MQRLLTKWCQRISFPVMTVLAVAWLTASARGDDVEFFENKIRPLLAEHCYKCHSAEAENLKAGLFWIAKRGSQ